MGKVIHLEMWKTFKFNHANKWYMHILTSLIENDSQKLLWDFDIETDHGQKTRPYNNQQKRELTPLST